MPTISSKKRSTSAAEQSNKEQSVKEWQEDGGVAESFDTLTPYNEFIRAKIIPTQLLCKSEGAAYDQGCHSRLIPTAESMIRHLDQDHGGGFGVQFRPANKAWRGFETLGKEGIEIVRMKCDVCTDNVPFSAPHIINHLKTHRTPGRRPRKGGKFWLTISRVKPQPTEMEAFLDDEGAEVAWTD